MEPAELLEETIIKLPVTHLIYLQIDPRPAVQNFRGNIQRIELPVDLCESLRALSRTRGCYAFYDNVNSFCRITPSLFKTN